MNLKIERFATVNYKSYIEITPENKNFEVLRKMDAILKKEGKTFAWLFDRLDLANHSLKSYLSGKEHISLKTIELIAEELREYINSPKELMNETFPILKLGRNFKLNIKELRNKYYITNSQLILGTGIDKGNLSCILNGKVTQLRPETLLAIFDFFKEKGVPLNSVLDLIYYPNWNESPLHFLAEQPKIRCATFKFNSSFYTPTNFIQKNGIVH
jgi:hypothetical protein